MYTSAAFSTSSVHQLFQCLDSKEELNLLVEKKESGEKPPSPLPEAAEVLQEGLSCLIDFMCCGTYPLAQRSRPVPQIHSAHLNQCKDLPRQDALQGAFDWLVNCMACRCKEESGEEQVISQPRIVATLKSQPSSSITIV